MNDINNDDLKTSKNERKRFAGLDTILVAFGAGILVVSTVLFFLTHGTSPIAKVPNQTNFVSIGSVKLGRGDFRRRVPTGFGWGTIATGDSVFDGDTLFTGDDSEAQLTLGQNELSIDSNSLLLIKSVQGVTEFDLQYGSLLHKIHNKQMIYIGNNGTTERIDAEKAEVRLMADSSGKGVTVQVLDGEIQISKQNEAEKKAHKGDVARLDAEGQLTIESPTIALLSPTPDQAMWLAPGLPAKFIWKRAGNQEVLFEVARDPQFQNSVFKQKMLADHYDFAADKRPEGILYWRVTTTDHVGSAPLPWRAQIYQDGAPTAQSPANNQQLAYTSNSGAKGKIVLFSWDDQTGSTQYDLQVSNDEDFKKIVYKNTLTQKSESSIPLEAGNYFWHVMGKNPERKSPHWSRALAFTITDDKKVPAKPELSTKQTSFTLAPEVLKSLTPQQEAHGKGFAVAGIPPFIWKSATDAESYEVQLSPDKDFKNAPKFSIKSGLQFSPAHVKPGYIYARVRGVSKSGLTGPYSDKMQLAVFLPAPALSHVPYAKELFATKKEFEEARHEFKVTWQSQPFAERYELEWAADKDFKLVRKYQVKDHYRVQTVSKPFDYYARVRTIDKNGDPLSGYSDTRLVKYQKQLLVAESTKKKPAAPKIIAQRSTNSKREPAGILIATIPKPSAIAPESDTSITTFENQKATVSFKWKKISVAQEYQLQIAADPEFENLVGTIWSPETQGKFNGFFPEGKVYWRVRTITKSGYGEWSDPSDFNVLWE